LFRRHPLSALAGLVATFSLAGIPGTPGGTLWFEAARSLAATRHSGLLFLLGLAWLSAFSTVMRQWREAAGISESAAPAGGGVPLPARAAMWIAAAGVIGLEIAWVIEKT
jgi:formate hydrogenlyase subunit 3/multisubunit Na+/H+ antiporter MnhD subunit